MGLLPCYALLIACIFVYQFVGAFFFKKKICFTSKSIAIMKAFLQLRENRKIEVQ